MDLKSAVSLIVPSGFRPDIRPWAPGLGPLRREVANEGQPRLNIVATQAGFLMVEGVPMGELLE
jgi:hypothetical protein